MPKRSDLRLNLEVGDLTIEGITGNTDAELGIGDLHVMVPDPHAYRAVAMSVHIGDVDASAFSLEPSAFSARASSAIQFRQLPAEAAHRNRRCELRCRECLDHRGNCRRWRTKELFTKPAADPRSCL